MCNHKWTESVQKVYFDKDNQCRTEIRVRTCIFLWQKEKGVDQGERSTSQETTEIYKTRPERYVVGSFLCPDVDRL